jgi:hypothetical protein
MSTVNLAERDKGQVPISIGTALAVEGALGIFPDRPVSPPPILKYKQVWFNLFTLFRNLMGSVDAEQQKSVLPYELVPALWEDMHGIAAAIDQASNGGIEPVFYLNDYSALPRVYPKASLKTPATPAQADYALLEQKTLRLLMSEKPSLTLRSYGLKIEGRHPASLIVTHFPVDLFGRYSFEKLDLLESHTGKIKTPAQWNTKLTVKDDVELLPFNEFTLQLFGDKSIQFRPLGIVLRREVMAVAKANHWSSVTTMEKIKATLGKVKDPEILALLKELL